MHFCISCILTAWLLGTSTVRDRGRRQEQNDTETLRYPHQYSYSVHLFHLLYQLFNPDITTHLRLFPRSSELAVKMAPETSLPSLQNHSTRLAADFTDGTALSHIRPEPPTLGRTRPRYLLSCLQLPSMRPSQGPFWGFLFYFPNIGTAESAAAVRDQTGA